MLVKKPTETELVKQCLELLKLRGVFAWRNNTGAAAIGKRQIRFGFKGSSDIIGIMPSTSDMPGSFLAIECKTGAHKATDEQKAFLESIRRHGGYALLVNDVVVLDMLISRHLWRGNGHKKVQA